MNTPDRDDINITVPNPEYIAQTLCELFGWQVRWAGPMKNGGKSIHVGTKENYIVLNADLEVSHPPASRTKSVEECTFTLNHVGIPARNPEALASWYGAHFNLMVEGAFAYGDHWLIACEPGAPLTEMPAHFGFMLNSRSEVDRWKEYFEKQDIVVDVQRDGNAIFISDPEGNSFEIFFDSTRFVPPNTGSNRIDRAGR